MSLGLFALLASSILGTGASIGINNKNVSNARQENLLNRKFTSEQNQLQRDFLSKEAELAYNRELEFYDSRQSPSAMVRQYRDAGLNPALLASGGVGSGSVSASPASGGVGSASTSPLPAMSNPLTAAMGMADVLSQIENIKAQTEKTKSETKLVDKELSWYDSFMQGKIDLNASEVSKNSQLINESMQKVSESVARVDEINSRIELNGSTIELQGSQKILNDTKTITERLNAESISQMIPYISERQSAEIALTQAKTKEAVATAEERLYQANVNMLHGMSQAKLIDSSYYEDLIEGNRWSAKMAKRSYKWSPINDVCKNVSMICVGAGSLISGVGAAAGGLGSAATAAASLEPLTKVGGFAAMMGQ